MNKTLCNTCDGCWYTCSYFDKYYKKGKCKYYKKEVLNNERI